MRAVLAVWIERGRVFCDHPCPGFDDGRQGDQRVGPPWPGSPSVYRVGDLEKALCRAGRGCVLGGMPITGLAPGSQRHSLRVSQRISPRTCLRSIATAAAPKESGSLKCPRPCQRRHRKNAARNGKELFRWSVQEIRRFAQRQLPVARILKWSIFRRAHQAAARRAHH